MFGNLNGTEDVMDILESLSTDSVKCEDTSDTISTESDSDSDADADPNNVIDTVKVLKCYSGIAT